MSCTVRLRGLVLLPSDGLDDRGVSAPKESLPSSRSSRSKASHLKAGSHKNAVQAEESARTAAMPLSGSALAASHFLAAPLSFIDPLGGSSNISTPINRAPSPLDDPFSHTIEYRDTFYDDNGHEILFSAGESWDRTTADRAEVQKQIDRLALLPDHSLFGRFSNDPVEDNSADPDSIDGAFSAALARMGKPVFLSLPALLNSDEGLNEESDEEDGEDEFEFARTDEEEDWFPHGSRTMFMLDLLDNLPRLRLSDDHLKSIIWVMRECKTQNVPSFSALRKKQASMTTEVKITSEHHTSSLGNHFYMNHPAKLLALDWANPLVRPFIHVYPEVAGPVAEFWQAEKWTSESALDQLSPMWADWKNKSTSHKHFYVNKLAQQHDGTYVVPVRWVTVNNEVHADTHDVREISEDLFEIKTGSYHQIPATSLKLNYLDLIASFPSMKFTEYSPHYEMPHPLRKKANGRPMFTLRVMAWSDDVSGNVSKQYNAHTNMYITNLNLPHQNLAQEYYVRFASTSPHASSSEQFAALGDDFIPGTWHEAYDCELEQDILFEVIQHLHPADNPQQSETASHIRMGGSLGCRRDLTGGTKDEQETDAGYEVFYSPGVPRDKEGTIQTIRWQVWNACGNTPELPVSYTQTGVKDKISQYWIDKLLEMGKERRYIQLRDRTTRDPRLNKPSLKGDARKAVKAEISRQIQQDLWDWVVRQTPESYALLAADDRIDPHRDTPGEILHTYLLGNDKYVWHDTTKVWDEAGTKADLFASRLASSSICGLSIPPPRPRYIVKYKNSLIGKHFKMLQQLGVFSMHDLCSPLLFDLWKATGELGALLWFPQINNMDQYLADLKVLIANLLDIWALIDPERILVKGKLHVFPHMPEDVLRFGPAILYATETFECWNAIFRLCSVFSNHLAPSRDIAATLADMERFKHVVSGGWWKGSGGSYIRAGRMVRSFLKSNKSLQRRLGWLEKCRQEGGAVKLEASTKRDRKTWNQMVKSTSNLPSPEPVAAFWVRCKYVVAQSGDLCKDGAWVFFRKLKAVCTQVGRTTKIIAQERDGIPSTSNVAVLIELFIVLEVKEERLNMPLLIPSPETKLVHVKPKEILFTFNAQHDCVGCKCSTAPVPVRQERIITERTELQTQHSPEARFLINMHGLHNAHLIRDILPRSLTAHHRLAAKLRQTGPAKRAEIQAKAQATKARNKQTKAKMASAQAQRQEEEHFENEDVIMDGE
ncbi:hypothetical protein C8R43DRAFT_1083606 [Mycena crocata]|nr:hypothetical protein C8R43DRAFT_1083606 [Mycena crocata]